MEALNECKASLGSKSVKVKTTWDGGRMALGDATKIRRMVSNIIDNAAFAIDDGGTLSFATSRVTSDGHDFIEVGIGNTGSLIPVEARDKIFESSYTHGKPSGTGLGLAIVKRFAQIHDGSVRCGSTAENGTWIYFSLPVATDITGIEVEFPPEWHGQKTLSHAQTYRTLPNRYQEWVVLVEDDELIAKAWQISLGDVQVLHFLTPEIFLSAAIIRPELWSEPTVFILDMQFPGSLFDGAMLAAHIKAKSEHSFVVMASNFGAATSRGQADCAIDKRALSWTELLKLRPVHSIKERKH